jgi:catechol-2,3-dioxygenase
MGAPAEGDAMAESQPFQLRKIGHVVLNVSDLEACARFYTEVLGLESQRRLQGRSAPGAVWSSCA